MAPAVLTCGMTVEEKPASRLPKCVCVQPWDFRPHTGPRRSEHENKNKIHSCPSDVKRAAAARLPGALYWTLGSLSSKRGTQRPKQTAVRTENPRALQSG